MFGPSRRVARRTSRRTSRRMASYNEPAYDEPQQAAPPQAAPEQPDMTEQLKDLAKLHEQGILTDEEFAAQKQKLLGAS